MTPSVWRQSTEAGASPNEGALCVPFRDALPEPLDVRPELCLGPVRELIGRCEPGLVGLGVLLHDQREVRFENARTEGMLIHCILFVVGRKMLLKGAPCQVGLSCQRSARRTKRRGDAAVRTMRRGTIRNKSCLLRPTRLTSGQGQVPIDLPPTAFAPVSPRNFCCVVYVSSLPCM